MRPIVLDATNKSITAVMSGAAATTNPDFTTHYADATTSTFVEGSNDGTLNGTTPVTLVAAPAASTRRIVQEIVIQNRDTASVTITLRYVSGANTRQLKKITLATNETATLDGNLDATGAAIGGTAGGSTIPLKENGSTVVTGATSIDFKDANVEDGGSGAGIVYLDSAHVFQARLTLTTAVPVTTADVTAATTVYLTPHRGSKIALYDGTRWKLYTLTEISIAVTASTNTNYDVFVYDNAGTLTLDLTAWTNDTTRATDLVGQNGVWVKTGATARRYVGTIRTTGVSGQTEDSVANRYVYNYYNRVQRYMQVTESTNTWTYATASWRSANNSTANRVNFVMGGKVQEDAIYAFALSAINAGVTQGSAGIGIDSTSANSAIINQSYGSAQTGANDFGHSEAHYWGYLGIGAHYIQWLEYTITGTVTFWGDNGGTVIKSGLWASICN